jgi:hypothetical protein
MNQNFSWTERGKLERAGFKMSYIWEWPQKEWSNERIRRVVDARREHFSEAGPGELPFAWALAEKDPV